MVARATAGYLKARAPEEVSLVAMGVQLKEKAPETVVHPVPGPSARWDGIRP